VSPRRRRESRRKTGPAGPHGDLFLKGDGVTPVLDDDPVYSSPFVARAAWKASRAISWSHPWRRSWEPPHGAVVYDGIGDRLVWRCRPDRDATGWRDEYRAAHAADVASVARFRAEEPDAAAEIGAELDVYAQHLDALLAVAVAADNPNAAQQAVGAYKAAHNRGEDMTWHA